jgi:hypothetical protein
VDSYKSALELSTPRTIQSFSHSVIQHPVNMSDEPRNEEEFLDRESRLAREALTRVRMEALESLGRTADASAWAERYPWQSLGTAAVAGVGAGWALGRTFHRKSSTSTGSQRSGGSADENATENDAAAPYSKPPGAALRLMSGLGTLTGALASAAFTAVAESLTEVVKDTVHDALHPDQQVSGEMDTDASAEQSATENI